MIPQFPEYKTLEFSDKEEIEKFTSMFPPYSDYHFTIMWCWGNHKPIQLSILNENLLIKHTDCLSGEYFFSLLGEKHLKLTIEELSNFLHKNRLPLILRWIPEETIKKLDSIKTIITEDKDCFDYIYDVSDLYNATGSKYKKYRKRISCFTRNYPDVKTQLLNLSSKDVKSQIDNLFKTWAENKKRSKIKEYETLFEYNALIKLLTSVNKFKSLVAIGIFDKDKMIAFTIEDIVDRKYGCGLFWKANINYVGVYQYLQKEIASFYHSREIKYINWDSDLGIESLRKSKLLYNPSFFLKKYTIQMNNNVLPDVELQLIKQDIK